MIYLILFTLLITFVATIVLVIDARTNLDDGLNSTKGICLYALYFAFPILPILLCLILYVPHWGFDLYLCHFVALFAIGWVLPMMLFSIDRVCRRKGAVDILYLVTHIFALLFFAFIVVLYYFPSFAYSIEQSIPGFFNGVNR